MASLATTLGLITNDLTTPVPCKAPYFLLFHIIFAHSVLSARSPKLFLKLDDNVAPREDLLKYGDRAVKDGKITQRQLNFLKRNEACHQNSMDHLPVFVGAVAFGVLANLPNETVNFACVWYTLARVVYAFCYLAFDTPWPAFARSIAWWAANWSCIYLLWKSGKAMGSL